MILDFFLFFSLFLSRKRSLSLSLSRFFLLFFCKGLVIKGSEINTGLDHKKKREEVVEVERKKNTKRL